MAELRRTILHPRHVSAGAKMVDFGGWEMPLLYPTGIVAEHIATRRGAGLFDVSHMGRFAISGRDAIAFLQHTLTNNAGALDIGEAQYTLIPTETGGAVDDAYLYRFFDDEYLLVVNAANREKDWEHLQPLRRRLNAMISDRTDEIAMLALQGPKSRETLLSTIEDGWLPEPRRNALSVVRIAGSEVWVGRTGYTGEPLCFETFLPREHALEVWDEFVARGATPVGLGARDTLRLEAALPLYGHELGEDAEGNEIPIFACPSARSGVSFSPRKGDFIGREALVAQQKAYRKMLSGDASSQKDLPRVFRPLALIGQGVARAGAKVFRNSRHVGYVTSGTAVPACSFTGSGLLSAPGEGSTLRSICLAYIDSEIACDERVLVEARGKQVEAAVVPWHLRSEAPPYARPIVVGQSVERPDDSKAPSRMKVAALLGKATANTTWRQRECINLIPSEMTLSPMVRLLSLMDPAFRYAEHRKVKAFSDADVFYYQGVDFIAEVERLLDAEMRKYLGCPEVETRLISGQMANTTMYSGLIDYLNRADRRREPRRIERVMNHHIGHGGHLSAQPMGGLRDYVAHDPRTERPAIVNFPVL
ncbi:MAG: glycine cleavage system aminomethyltransferase GcvT, partial [Armatimonadota bacterium]